MCASQGLPFPELPSIEWIIKAVEVLLGKVIVNKALVLPIGDEGEAPSLDMSSVGLGTFSLTQLHSMSTAERASLVHGIASHLRDNHLKIGWRAGRLVNDIVVEKPSLTDGSSSLTYLSDMFAPLLAHPSRGPHVPVVGALPSVSIETYEDLLAGLEKPAWIDNWASDEVFAWQRVAGSNPVTLHCKTHMSDAIAAGFTEEELGAVGLLPSGAFAEGRVFVADYAVLKDLNNGSSSFTGTLTPKFVYYPVALFVLSPEATASDPELPRAVAIKVRAAGMADLFVTPDDGELWTKAKYIVANADTTHHELISHLGRTHLFVEPFAVATKRILPAGHPVNLLLAPHVEGTIFINHEAVAKLIVPNGGVDEMLPGTLDTELALVGRIARATFNSAMLPADLFRRGVTSKALLYPYRDDAVRVWTAISNYVSEFLDVFYKDDEAVLGDEALQMWATELLTAGQLPEGDFGDGPSGVMPLIRTKSYVGEVATMVIFTASAQHAAVNFTQASEMTYVPSYPGSIYVGPAELLAAPADSLLPSVAASKAQVSLLALLGGVHYTTLGDKAFLQSLPLLIKEALHPQLAWSVFPRFQSALAAIEEDIVDANRDGSRPYPYVTLLPSLIPQSINI